MVDLGQKKVDSHPPFFMRNSEQKKSRVSSAIFILYNKIYFSFSCANLAETSFQLITLKNALI